MKSLTVKKYLPVFLFLVVIFLSITVAAICQPTPSSAPGDPGGDGDVPISGIEILLLLGGAFGIKRIFGRRSSKK